MPTSNNIECIPAREGQHGICLKNRDCENAPQLGPDGSIRAVENIAKPQSHRLNKGRLHLTIRVCGQRQRNL